jgi:choline dehydrogenase-like flavoprotein
MIPWVLKANLISILTFWFVASSFLLSLNADARKQPCFASPFFPHVPEPNEGSYMTIVVSLLRPLSRGSLTLKSADALDFPLINMNYLDHPLDAVALREGVRFVDEIVLRGDGMEDIIIGEYPEGEGGIVRGEPKENGSSDGVYGAKKGEKDEGKSVEGNTDQMLGLDKVRESDEGMAQWLKGRVTSGYRKFSPLFF